MPTSNQKINKSVDTFYNVKKHVGNGASGSVYKAQDVKTGEIVAIKHFSEEDNLPRLTFQRERDAMNLVSHPNVNKCIAAFADWKGAPAVVVPFAGNGDLLAFMIAYGHSPEKIFPERMCRTLLVKIFGAIKACHDSGVIHRDIKPENILLDGKFQPIVCDFGYAAIPFSSSTSRVTTMKTKCGTEAYAAPEVLIDGHQTLAIDVWSLGVLAFLLYCGFPPYAEPTIEDHWYRKIKNGDWISFWRAHEKHAKFHSDFKKIIHRMLCIDPKNRATLKEVLESKWMAMEVLSSENLEKNFIDLVTNHK
eukprot:jgi/Bigna1/53864/estExt_Genewise1Plus.C_250090